MPDDAHLIAKFNATFSGMRVIENLMFPAKWSIKTQMEFSEEFLDMPDETFDTELNFVLRKLKFFTSMVLDGSVFYYRENDWAHRAFGPENPSGNNIVLCAEQPNDSHIAELIQAKFTAIGQNQLDFITFDIECNDDFAEGVSYTIHGNASADLPNMKQWVGEKSWHPVPWWHRNDVSTMDFVPADSDDLNVPFAIDLSWDFLRDRIIEIEKPSAAIIRPQFKPEVIKGGKD